MAASDLAAHLAVTKAKVSKPSKAVQLKLTLELESSSKPLTFSKAEHHYFFGV